MAESIKSRGGLEMRRRVIALAAIAAALTAAACGRSVSGEATSDAATTSATAPTTTTSTTAPTTTEPTPSVSATAESSTKATLPEGGPYFTFDDLGDGSSVIQVYAGPGESAADRKPVGTYYDGDSVPVDCIEVDGRELSSDPDADGKKKTSDIWFGLHNPVTNEEFYASYVYGAPNVVPDSLPDC